MTIACTLHADHEPRREDEAADRRWGCRAARACCSRVRGGLRQRPAFNAIDLLVAGDYVVTMNDAGQVIEDGAVAVDDGPHRRRRRARGDRGEVPGARRRSTAPAGSCCRASSTDTRMPR